MDLTRTYGIPTSSLRIRVQTQIAVLGCALLLGIRQTYLFGRSSTFMILTDAAFIPSSIVTVRNSNISTFSTSSFLSSDISSINSKTQWSSNPISTRNETDYYSNSFLKDVTRWLDTEKIPHTRISLKGAVGPVLALGNTAMNDTVNHNDSIDNYNKLVLHLLATPTNQSTSNPHTSANLTNQQFIVHLHEDLWNDRQRRGVIVRSRLIAKLHPSKRIYARKTIVRRITSPVAMEFLEKHHLWGSTKAKFNYGLFTNPKPSLNQTIHPTEELVAVATFSPRRHVHRPSLPSSSTTTTTTRPYRSHELIRYCSQRDAFVTGGITKLLAAFCRENAPDDIVTCIDRDWGGGGYNGHDGGGWERIGFVKVATMPPLLMVVDTNDNNDSRSSSTTSGSIRRYLVGAGIQTPTTKTNQITHTMDNNNSNINRTDQNQKKSSGRPGLPTHVVTELDQVSTAKEAWDCLLSHNLFPVYDAGVERRMLVLEGSKLDVQCHEKRKELKLQPIRWDREFEKSDPSASARYIRSIWQTSTPKFPDHYYSNNHGIHLLLEASRLGIDPSIE